MEIRKVDNGLVQENQIFIRGIGASSLFIDELEWTVQVLENQVSRKKQNCLLIR